jgi:hypothetical protein
LKIAVVGAGIYGVLSALELSSSFNAKVDLYDERGFMVGASAINQFRIHVGYHYPRSKETVQQVSRANKAFLKRFSNAIIQPRKSFYAVARNESKTKASVFEEFCGRFDLPYKESIVNWINYEKIEKVYEVKEDLYDIQKIRLKLQEEVNRSNLVFLHKKFQKQFVSDYDIVIYCTYGLSTAGNTFSDDREIQLVEKVKIKLESELQGISLVVIDGAFTAFDPLPFDLQYSQFGSGKYTKHDVQNNINKFEHRKRKFINTKHYIKVPFTHFNKLKQNGAQFVPAIENAVYEGSKFTYRIVEKDKNTDKRLLELTKVGEREYAVLSGKVVSAADVSIKIRELVLQNV